MVLLDILLLLFSSRIVDVLQISQSTLSNDLHKFYSYSEATTLRGWPKAMEEEMTKNGQEFHLIKS